MTAPARIDPTEAVPFAPAMQRAYGRSRVGFRQVDGETRLAELWQEGCAKIRLPRVHDGRGPVAVLLNTAGGITGGDDIVTTASWGEGTRATVTSQTAERIYRRSSGVGHVVSRLDLAAGAVGAWLPQETIVFDGAGLDRTLDVTLVRSSRLVACEAVVLGRTAMGETVRRLDLIDRWRIRRDGRLLFADQTRLRGDPSSILAGPATASGATAFATLVMVSAEAASFLDRARFVMDSVVGEDLEGGASTFDDVLVVRLLAREGRALRRALVPLTEALIEGPLPRVWSL